MQHMLELDPGALVPHARPVREADEAVDRRLRLLLADRHLQLAPAERVAPVGQAVRPRREHLAARGAREIVGGVRKQHVAAADRERPQPAADLDRDGARVAVRDLVLLSRRLHDANVSRRRRAALASSA
jgi:hypothetical protein